MRFEFADGSIEIRQDGETVVLDLSEPRVVVPIGVAAMVAGAFAHAAGVTFGSGRPWHPLDVEAEATVGDRILVFLPKTHETLVAEYEELPETDQGGAWMVDGGLIDPDDGALWTEIPVPSNSGSVALSPAVQSAPTPAKPEELP